MPLLQFGCFVYASHLSGLFQTRVLTLVLLSSLHVSLLLGDRVACASCVRIFRIYVRVHRE